MTPTDESEKAGAASPASPRGPEGAEMMPTLPEPWEGLVGEALVQYARFGYFGSMSANHAAFEAERALRLAILGYPHDAAFGAIARLTDEGTPSKE